MNSEYSWKKTQIEKKKANSVLSHVRADFQSMMREECLNSFMKEALIK